MLISKINSVSYKNNSDLMNFKSRVIYEDSQIPLSSEIRRFIDKFEEKFPKNNNGRRKVEKGYTDGSFTVFSKSGGESGDVYMIEPNYGGKKFVIKESIPLMYKDRADEDLGGLRHEYNAMVEASEASTSAQKPMAYVKTLKGASFLLSEFIPNIVPVNSKTDCYGQKGVKMNEKYFKSVLNIVENFDKANFFDPDMTRANVSIDKNDGTAKILDFQWALTKGTHTKKNNKVFTFVPFEEETTSAAFEGSVLADYPIGELKELRKQQGFMNFSTTVEEKKQEIRNKLKEYFKLRAEYAEKLGKNNDFEKVKAEVYKNPSDDVLDAEILRMSILRNNRLQFLYTDDNIERPRNMMKLIRYSSLAKLSASKLAEFVPQTTPRTTAERKYFEYMKRFGKEWDKNTSTWYPDIVNFMVDVIQGKDRAPGRYFAELFEGTKDEPFTLFDILKNTSIGEDIMDVNDNVSSLERKLLSIKRGKYCNSYELRELINNLYAY